MMDTLSIHVCAGILLKLTTNDLRLQKLNGCELAAVLHSAAGTVEAATTAAATIESYKKLFSE